MPSIALERVRPLPCGSCIAPLATGAFIFTGLLFRIVHDLRFTALFHTLGFGYRDLLNGIVRREPRTSGRSSCSSITERRPRAPVLRFESLLRDGPQRLIREFQLYAVQLEELLVLLHQQRSWVRRESAPAPVHIQRPQGSDHRHTAHQFGNQAVIESDPGEPVAW